MLRTLPLALGFGLAGAVAYLGGGRTETARLRHGWGARQLIDDRVSRVANRSARARKQENPVTVFGRILTVCVGNICRSPTAEYLLRQQVASWGIQVGSAGLAAMVDSPVEATAAQLMGEHGMDSSVHRARQVTPALLREADLVLGMEKGHLTVLANMAPEASGKLFLLDKWGEAQDIPDPYRQQRPAFEHVYALIDRGVQSWLPYLR